MAKATKKTEEVAVDMEEVRQAAIVNLVNAMGPKTFKSGKTGFYAQGKITVGGVRYQSQIMLTKIEPK